MKFYDQRNRKQFTEIFDAIPPPMEVKSGNRLCEPFIGLLNFDEADSHTNLNTNIVTDRRLSKLPGSSSYRNQLVDSEVVCHSVQTREPIAHKVFELKTKKLQEETVKLNWEKLFLTTLNLSHSVQMGLPQQQVSNESHNLAAMKARNLEPLKKLQHHQTLIDVFPLVQQQLTEKREKCKSVKDADERCIIDL